MEVVLIALLTIIAAGVGTLTGFGTSTIMVPVLLLWYPLPETLLVVGVIHWFGNIWKITLFRMGFDLKLAALFGVPGVLLTWVGAQLVFGIEQEVLVRLLGVFLLAYTLFIFAYPRFKLPTTSLSAMLGGSLSGFFAGLFGVGGAIRGAFLAGFNLPKATYIATAGAIGLIIDSGRLMTYVSQGAYMQALPIWSLTLFIPASLLGAGIAKKIVDRIPQREFRLVVAVFLGIVAVRFLVWA